MMLLIVALLFTTALSELVSDGVLFLLSFAVCIITLCNDTLIPVQWMDLRRERSTFSSKCNVIAHDILCLMYLDYLVGEKKEREYSIYSRCSLPTLRQPLTISY